MTKESVFKEKTYRTKAQRISIGKLAILTGIVAIVCGIYLLINSHPEKACYLNTFYPFEYQPYLPCLSALLP